MIIFGKRRDEDSWKHNRARQRHTTKLDTCSRCVIDLTHIPDLVAPSFTSLQLTESHSHCRLTPPTLHIDTTFSIYFHGPFFKADNASHEQAHSSVSYAIIMSSTEDNAPPSSPSADPHSYARRHNLCTNYQDDGSSVLQMTDGKSYGIEDDDAESQDTNDDWRLERMKIENSTLAYLATMLRLEDDEEGLLASNLLGWRDLHVDHPTLSHDHDLHIGKIQKRYSDLSCLRFFSQLQQEHRDMFDDLVTTSSHDAVEQESEMLEVSRDTSHAIREILKLQRLDLKDVWQTLPSLHEPALLSDGNEKSGFSDSSMRDLQISQEDLEDMVAEDTFQLLNGSDQATSDQSIVDHARFEDLKITSPLLRPSENSHINEKTSLRQHCDSDLLQSTSSFQLPSIDAEISSNLLSTYQVKHNLDHEIMQERLVDIDTTLRIPLPELQAIEIEEPWQSEITTVERTEEHKSQLRSCRSLLGSSKWRGLSKLERRLTWKPYTFSYLSSYDLSGQEVFAKQIANQYLPIDQVSLLDMAQSVQPPPSIQIRDSDGAFEQPLLPVRTISDMAHIHSQNLSDANITLQRPLMNNMTAALYKRKREMDGESANKRTHTGQAISRRTSARPTGYGGEPSMAMFLSLQGIHTGNSHGLDYDTDTQKRTLPAIVAANPVDNTNDVRRVTQSLPTPAYQVAATPAQIIVTTATMSRRSLVEKLIKQAPHVEMIERTTNQARSAHTMIEADISLSPSSGLMLTTLQRIKQKRLPGQDVGKQDIGLRQQIAQVAQRYQDITILVSEGRAEKLDSTEYQDLTVSDCESLADLMAWSASLSTTVDVTYVAGGETELSSWICGHIISNAQSIRLMSEESRWERYLRCCGFNAYAAQVFLADLDRHSAAENSSNTLLKLMNLSKAEKDRISILLGGNKNLNCLMFDGTWYHKHVKSWNRGLDSGKHQPQWL
ncbi:hypothetical protein MRB53_041654 [Persea americana]|nr:hypothetical protein MRB53_041654 [Persea americana]